MSQITIPAISLQSRQRNDITTPQTAVVQRQQQSLEQKPQTLGSIVKAKGVKVELESVQSMVNQVRQEFQARNIMCQRLEASITSKVNQLHDLRKQLSEIGASSASLKSHLDFYESKHRDLAKAFDLLRNEISINLIDDMKRFQSTVESGINYMEQSTLDLQHIDIHIEFVMDTIASQLDLLIRVKEEHLSDVGVHDKCVAESKQLTTDLHAESLQLHDLNSQLRQLQDEHARLLQDGASFDFQLGALVSERATLEGSISNMTEELQSLNRTSEESSALHKEITEELVREKSEFQHQLQALQDAKLRYEMQLDASMECLRTANADRDASISAIAKLDEEAETLSLELDRLRRREQELKEKCNETVSHLESLKIKLAQEKHLEADFLKEREKAEALEREIDVLTATEKELQGSFHSLEALLSSKVAEAESITAKACAEEEEWKGKAETLEFKKQSICDEIEQLKREFAEVSSSHDADELILHTQQDEITRCKDEQASVMTFIGDAANQSEQSSKSIADIKQLGASIKEDEKEIKRLRLVLEKCKADAAKEAASTSASNSAAMDRLKRDIDKELETSATAREIEALEVKIRESKSKLAQPKVYQPDSLGPSATAATAAVSTHKAAATRAIADFDSLLEDEDAAISMKPTGTTAHQKMQPVRPTPAPTAPSGGLLKEMRSPSPINNTTTKAAAAVGVPFNTTFRAPHHQHQLQARVAVSKHPSGPISKLNRESSPPIHPKSSKENVPALQNRDSFDPKTITTSKSTTVSKDSTITYGGKSSSGLLSLSASRGLKELGSSHRPIAPPPVARATSVLAPTKPSTTTTAAATTTSTKVGQSGPTKPISNNNKKMKTSDWFFDDDDSFSFMK